MAQADAFSVNQARLRAWLAASAADCCSDADADDLTVSCFYSGSLHEGLARDVGALIEAGVIRQPPGWSVRVWPIEDHDRWAYFVAVSRSDEAADGDGGPALLIATPDEEVASGYRMRDVIEHIVRDANSSLLLARRLTDAGWATELQDAPGRRRA